MFHFSEKSVWSTCLVLFFVFFHKWVLSRVCGKQCHVYPPVFLDFSIALEAI